jgi:hypothetical protein
MQFLVWSDLRTNYSSYKIQTQYLKVSNGCNPLSWSRQGSLQGKNVYLVTMVFSNTHSSMTVYPDYGKYVILNLFQSLLTSDFASVLSGERHLVGEDIRRSLFYVSLTMQDLMICMSDCILNIFLEDMLQRNPNSYPLLYRECLENWHFCKLNSDLRV